VLTLYNHSLWKGSPLEHSMKAIVAGTFALALSITIVQPSPAVAWGDEGHEVVALVAQSFLDPDVRKRVTALLAADTDPLTPHNIANTATWADKYRDANIDNSRQRTSQWHFVDIELASPNFDVACFDHPPIPSGKPASNGPADDCVADRVQEFAGELVNPATDIEEQVAALKFLLHFVGDLHQPLHNSDEEASASAQSTSPALLQPAQDRVRAPRRKRRRREH
jgi:hypothetical protein